MRHLVISDFGTFISKKSERLVIRKNGEVICEVPFFQIEQVTLEGRGIALSTDAVKELTEQGIQINFLSPAGQPYAKITSPALTASVEIRRAQIAAYEDARGVTFAKAIVAGKIINQANLIRYFRKYARRKGNSVLSSRLDKCLKEILAKAQGVSRCVSDTVEECRGGLLALEAAAGRAYWSGVRALIGFKSDFESREHAGAAGAVNSALNYGYGFLYNRVWGAVVLAGLEPFAGFVHVDRPGKPSLVLDLVEEFRQPVVDRVVISLINKGTRIETTEEGLSAKSKTRLRTAFTCEFDRLRPYAGKKQKMANIIQLQARRLAAVFRGNGAYKPYAMPW